MKLDLKHLRYHVGMTQSEASERAGIKQSSLSQLENAGTSTKLSTLENVTRALGCRLKLSVITPMGEEIELDCIPYYDVKMVGDSQFLFTRRRCKEPSLCLSIVLQPADGKLYVTDQQSIVKLYTSMENFLEGEHIRLDGKNKTYLNRCLQPANFAV